MDEELKLTINVLKQSKIKINTHSLFYDSGLLLYLIYKTNDFAEVKWLINELITIGLKISKKIFSLMLYAIEDYTDAIYMLGLKDKYDISLNSNEYAILLSATNNLIEAEIILEQMKKDNIEFSLLIFGLLIEKSASYSEAKTFFHEIKEKNFVLNTNIYHQLLVKMDSNNLDETILKEMSDLGFNYEEETYNIYKFKSSLRTNLSFRQGLKDKYKDSSIQDIFKKLDIKVNGNNIGSIFAIQIKEKLNQSKSSSNSRDWSEEEVNIIVSDYFDMLLKEMNGQTYSKTGHRKILKPKLKNRSDSSIEFKHQNISAVLIDNDLPYIYGYKPKFNTQDLLKKAVLKRFKEEILDKYQVKETDTVNNQGSTFIGRSFSDLVDKAPETSSEKKRNNKDVTYVNLDFAEIEQNNKSLGKAGENFVFDLERQKLKEIGRTDLKVTWVSEDKGDGLGYDILSFDKNGNKIFIEVKTTNGSKSVPFYISDNEFDVLKNNLNNYYIYRVFNFKKGPRVFILTAYDFLKLLIKPKNFLVYPTKSNTLTTSN